ncbi:MAG TPA: hypothetical protein VGG55_00305, partial [Candidatus Acidoferrales bacterium]
MSASSKTLIGAIIGALAAAVLAHLGLAPAGRPVGAILLGAIFGAGFACLTSARSTSPGAGLLWGLAYSFLLWLAGPAGFLSRHTSNAPMGMLDAARQHFPELVGYLLVFGAPLGLALGMLSAGKRPRDLNVIPFSLLRALVAGGLAGI